ncbi:MAG TPA: hypothetical protein VIM55_20145 [Mucilaginibacter sp.]
MKLFLSITLLLFMAQFTCAQIKLTKIDPKTLPKTVQYKGVIDHAVKYSDKAGEHLMITTEANSVKKSEDSDDEKTQDLFASNYLLTYGQWILEWQMHDLVDACQFDMGGGYIPNTFAVTDLNNDGIAEVWLTYTLVCRSDVSPDDMKIIMHEGSKKFAMRGHTKVKVNATRYMGGDYKFDDAFKAGPDAFRQYALKLWNKNVVE